VVFVKGGINLFNRNEDIKTATKGIPNWAIAEKLNISENSYYRLMRKELSQEKKQEILKIVNEIKHELAKAQ
jgi:hypothetical protein